MFMVFAPSQQPDILRWVPQAHKYGLTTLVFLKNRVQDAYNFQLVWIYIFYWSYRNQFFVVEC